MTAVSARLAGQHGSLFLVGLRGAGKSTAGQVAAPLAGLQFVDADREVERRAGRSIGAIFARDGEAAFRAHERALMIELLARGGLLVATGGGCVLDPEVHARLRAAGTTVWLHAPARELADRIRASSRPTLTGAPIDAELVTIATQRRPLYASCAAARVETGGRSVSDVADQIARLWSERSGT